MLKTLFIFAGGAAAAVAASTVQFRDASGLPFLPFGFYQYGVSSPFAAKLPLEEAPHGMTLACPYASSAAPDSQWFADMDAFMDLALMAGFKVHFQLIKFQNLPNSPEVLANLTLQINRYKDHPALLAWYLADEPDGQHLDPEFLQKKYDLIKQLDKDHAVSMVFCCGGAASYANALDVIMVDPYPIPNSDASTVVEALASVQELGKTTIMVPQSFGGGEAWGRGPTSIEERLMTYLGLLHGVSGIQYFIRSPELGFPYAESAWSEIRQIAAEVRELESALVVGYKDQGVVRRSVSVAVSEVTKAMRGSDEACKAIAGGWVDRDGSIVVLAAELGSYDGLPCEYEFTVPKVSSNFTFDVELMFENRFVARDVTVTSAMAGQLTFKDVLRSHAVAAFRVVPVSQTPRSDGIRMITLSNPGYEMNVNPATPDSNYPDVSKADIGSTFFSDSRLSTEGRHSLRFHTANNGTGVKLVPYRFGGNIIGGSQYEFSIDLKGAKGGEEVHFDFSTTLFSLEPSNSSRDDNTFVATAGSTGWKRLSMKLKGVSNNGDNAHWLKYGMEGNGDVWLDNMELAEVTRGSFV
eukprot:TRINITY_DN37007_c0_g1_i1.p1 TRINITY_DN37007_c0_g1~~TRINITY_DN37007_c0_g1_i1.p1  ORF type:complete len:580 (+),score=79.98 TRINITY_DN37007_c0_g1_i1:71-1810(+)